MLNTGALEELLRSVSLHFTAPAPEIRIEGQPFQGNYRVPIYTSTRLIKNVKIWESLLRHQCICSDNYFLRCLVLFLWLVAPPPPRVGAQGVPWNPPEKTIFPPKFCNEICTIYVRDIKNHNSAKKLFKCCTVSKWRPNNRFLSLVISIVDKF